MSDNEKLLTTDHRPGMLYLNERSFNEELNLILIIPPQTKFGGYTGISLSGRLSVWSSVDAAVNFHTIT